VTDIMRKSVIFAAAAVRAAPLQAITPMPPVTANVRYGDLNLTSAKDQKRLRHRIVYAASWICVDDSGATPAPPPVNPECFRQTTKDAFAQMERAIARANSGQLLAASGPQ